MATDPLTLVDKIVHEVKSQGVFDEFRKDSMADVDTKPAYQNLRQRVETSVKKFLSEQRWTPDTNKYQLRERLRRHITESGFLDVGVERIVDQVVNPKIGSVFQPRIEEIAYKYLGIPTPPPPKIDPAPPPLIHPLPPLPLTAPPSLKVETADLMPTDLEQVSPDSDQATVKSEIKDEVEETPSQFAMEHNKLTSAADYDDEDESPPFEPLVKEEEAKMKKREALVKSEMEPITESGGGDSRCVESPLNRQPSTIAETGGPGTTSRDTVTEDNSPPPSATEKDSSLVQSLDVLATQESQQLSQVSSNSRLSLMTGTASQEVEEDATENSAAAPAERRQSLDRESAATAAAACNISEEAQMPKFSENSSEPAKSAGGSGATPARQLHFDIKQDEIKFEGTDRKANLRAIEQEALQQEQHQQKHERQLLQLDALDRCGKIGDNQPPTERRDKGGHSAGHCDADAERSQSTGDTSSRHAVKVSPSAEPVRQDEQREVAMRSIAIERSLTSSQDGCDSSSAHLVIVEKSEREETTEKSLAAPGTAASELDRDEMAEPANSSSPVVLEAAPPASGQPTDRHDVKSHSESRTSSSRHRKHARPKQRSHDRDRERERERERDRNREKERDKGKDKEKEKTRDREKDKEKEKDRAKESANEKDKENGKSKDKEREKDKDKDRDREREKDKDREREKDKNKEIVKERDKERDKEKDTERDKEKEKDREKDKDRESGREKERGKEKDREKERECEKDKEKIKDKERDKDRDKDKERDKTKPSEKDRENDKEKIRAKEKGREKDREKDKDKEKDKGDDKEKSNDKESKSEKDRERDRTREREKSHKNDRDRSTRERHTRSKHSGSSSSASKTSSSGSGNATASATIPSSPRSAGSSKEKAEAKAHPTKNAAGTATASSPSSSSSRIEDIAVADKKDTTRRSERHSDVAASAEKRGSNTSQTSSPTTKPTSERKSSSSSAAATKDDHNEAKDKPLRRKSTDSNDEDKSAGAPAPPTALQLAHNGVSSTTTTTSTSSKPRQKHNSSSGGGSGSKYKKTTHELLDEQEQLPQALPAEDSVSPQAQPQHRVVILSDILQNPDTDFIELDSQRRQVMTSAAATPIISEPATTTSAAPPSPTPSPELQFFESANSDGFNGRLQMLADLIDNCRQVAHCLGISPTATPTSQADEEGPPLHLEQPTTPTSELHLAVGGGRPKRRLNAVATVSVSDCSPTKRGKLSPTSSEASMGSKENEAVDKNTSVAAIRPATSQTNQINKHKSAAVKRYTDHTTTKMPAEKLQQQRYASEDLYKPRPVLSLRSKRATRHD